MIYIDPPYNTGQDFVYPDNFKEGLGTYLEWTKQVNEEGQKLSTNSESEGRFHSNWLNMMYPRLKLARNLMEDEGIIFISIGVDEQDNLRKICNEIFGEQNFIATFVWEKTQHFGRQKVNTYSNYDFILCYARNLRTANGLKRELLVEYEKSEFDDAPLYNASNPTKVVSFPRGTVRFNLEDGVYGESSDDKYELLSDVVVADGFNENDFALRFRSRWSAKKVIEELQSGTTYWVKTRAFAIRAVYGANKLFKESPRETILTNRSAGNATLNRFGLKVGTSEEGSAEVRKLLGGKFFDYPKPSSLLQYLVSLVEPGVVLDFFAGSSTTADAVMRVNVEDQGKRSFIMVQLPEPLSGSFPEQGSRGLETIADVSRMRIRKVSEQLEEQAGGKNVGDLGFRAYKLSDTNFTKWQVSSDTPANELEQHLLDLRESVNDNATPADLFVELLLKQGYSLTEDIGDVSIAGLDLKTVLDSDGDVAVLAYLDEHFKPTLDQLREIVDSKPVRFVILEDCFQGDDELKTNLVQICKTNGIELWTA
jgi:adenine-specific DNA-methyltransferase